MSDSGHVYVLINPSLDGLLKIGKTARSPIDRAKELSSSTGVPTPFVVAYDAYFSDCSEAEQYVHTKLESKGYRLSPNKEFFNAPLKDVIDAIIEATHSLNHSTDDNTPDNNNPIITELRGLLVDLQDEDELTDNISSPMEEDEGAHCNYSTVAYKDSRYLLSLIEINHDLGIQLKGFSYEDTEDLTKMLSMKDSITDLVTNIVENIASTSDAIGCAINMVTGFTMCVDMFDSDEEKYSDLLEDKDQIFYCLTYLKDNPDSINNTGLVYLWVAATALIKFYENLFSMRNDLTNEQQSFLNDAIESASAMTTEFDTYVKDINTIIETAIPDYERYLSQIRRIVKYEYFTNHSVDETAFLELRNIFKRYRRQRRLRDVECNKIINEIVNNFADDNAIPSHKPWDDLFVKAIDSRYGNKEEGIIKDPNEAKDFYISASKLGSSAALVELGDMQLEGELGEPSKVAALKYYKEAVKKGNAIAYLRMAKLFAEDDEDNTDICIDAYIKRRDNLQSPVTEDTINEIYNFLYNIPDNETFLPYLKYFSPVRKELLSRFEQGDPWSNLILGFVSGVLDGMLRDSSDPETHMEDMLDLIP